MTFAPTADEIADRYRDSRVRVMGLIDALAEDQLAIRVPGTPKWTVRDLIGHFVGCPIELAAGHFEGAGGDEWTQAQVEARRPMVVTDLMTEWKAAADGIDAAIRVGNVPVPVTLDILTHESDLRGAIGAEPTRDRLAIRFVADGFGTRAHHVAAKADLAPLELRATDSDWSIGTAGGVSAEATEYEWTRALAGRRSARQVTAYRWSGDPAAYLDLLCPFGPLPEDDVAE